MKVVNQYLFLFLSLETIIKAAGLSAGSGRVKKKQETFPFFKWAE